ncbi:MAG: 3',5'-cyclic-nucleotide phosphodiesterase, partial [Sediminibacterium sp.]|nr:3',5'-cyclic-nucleotide phosphodiesterase [Sediminibacterium sp.]
MKQLIFSLLLLLAHPLLSQKTHRQQPAFDVVPLGVLGGIDESNLSAYLVSVAGTSAYIGLDA